MVHTCSPTRWRNDQQSAGEGPAHSLVAAGSTFGFAEAQLQSAVLVGFQKLLRMRPDVAASIATTGRFPSWEAVAGDDPDAAISFLHTIQCRRTVEALTGISELGPRAILTLSGWNHLASEFTWQVTRSTDRPAPVRADVLGKWLEALLKPETLGSDDSRQDVLELAASSFLPQYIPGGTLAALAVQRLGRRDARASALLIDAISGETGARVTLWRDYEAAVGHEGASVRAFDAALAIAVNPPLFVTALDETDTIPDWTCLQPGLRFRRLCEAMADAPPLALNADIGEVEEFVDALCVRCNWPKHSTLVARVSEARAALSSDPSFAEIRGWLAEHWAVERGRELGTPPPASYACCRYIGFLDAFVDTRGGLLTHTVDGKRLLFRCEPNVTLDDNSAPAAMLATVVHNAAVLVIGDLMEGRTLSAAVSTVLEYLSGSGWTNVDDELAASLRLPSLQPLDL